MDLLSSGGWMMLPIIISSIVSVGVILERLWFLRSERIAPLGFLSRLKQIDHQKWADRDFQSVLKSSCPLGEILSGYLSLRIQKSGCSKGELEEIGRHVCFGFEKNLGLLGTIASVCPLFGLLGTVFGMIEVFSVITTAGIGEASRLAGGISQALVSTAAGLVVAIPSLIFYRFFLRRVETLCILIEQETTDFANFVDRTLGET